MLKTSYFLYPLAFLSRLQDMIRFGLGMQVAKTLIYTAMCRFPLFAGQSDHYTNVTDRQTDGRTDLKAEVQKLNKLQYNYTIL